MICRSIFFLINYKLICLLFFFFLHIDWFTLCLYLFAILTFYCKSGSMNSLVEWDRNGDVCVRYERVVVHIIFHLLPWLNCLYKLYRFHSESGCSLCCHCKISQIIQIINCYLYMKSLLLARDFFHYPNICQSFITQPSSIILLLAFTYICWIFVFVSV